MESENTLDDLHRRYAQAVFNGEPEITFQGRVIQTREIKKALAHFRRHRVDFGLPVEVSGPPA